MLYDDTSHQAPTSNMYTFCGQTLTSVTSHCYLGIHLSNTLNWTNQTKVASTKAQQTLGVIRRNLNKCPTQCLSQDLDFSQKRSYLIFLGSYLQKRGVIHSQRKLRAKARKLRERVRSLYILHAQNTKIVAS